MELSDSGDIPHGVVFTPSQAAQRLGHPLAALADEQSRQSPMVECGYAGDAGPQRFDSVLLTYLDPRLCIGTARLTPDQVELSDAARGALAGYRMNSMPGDSVDDMETWMLAAMDQAYSLDPRPTASPLMIDGKPYQPVAVGDGVHEALALETDTVRVTVVGPQVALAHARLHWWRPRIGRCEERCARCRVSTH